MYPVLNQQELDTENIQKSSLRKVHALYSNGERRTSDCHIRRLVEIRDSAARNSNFPVLLRLERHQTGACQIPGDAWEVQVSKCGPRKRHLHVGIVWNSSQKASGTEAGTCIHCKNKQRVEDGDGPVYSSGSTQTPGADAQSEEVVSSSFCSASSFHDASGGARASTERPPAAAPRSRGRRQYGSPPDTPPPGPSLPPPRGKPAQKRPPAVPPSAA